MASTNILVCSLSVTLTGMKNQDGQLCFSLFNGAAGFPGGGEQAIAKQLIPANSPSPSIVFDNLEPGTYAVAAFHDANGDGLLNRGLMGIPREGFGFSNNPKILVGAPSFKKAAIALTQTQLAIQIQLKYF